MATNKLEQEEFNEILIDVRKSFRFLYLFQRRVMDLVKFIGNHYEFVYQEGHSHYSNTHKPKSGGLEKWAWDFLPMYHFNFQFNSREINGKEFCLSVLVQCDTGFYDKDLKQQNDKLDIHRFNSVEESQTVLHLILRESKNGLDLEKYKKQRRMKGSPNMFPESSTELDENDIWLGYKFSILEMINEETTLECLKKFESHCRSMGFEIKPVKEENKNQHEV